MIRNVFTRYYINKFSHLNKTVLTCLFTIFAVMKEQAIAIGGEAVLCHVTHLNEQVFCCKCDINGDYVAVGLMNGTVLIYKGVRKNSFSDNVYMTLQDEETKQQGMPATFCYFPLSKSNEAEKNLLLVSYANGMIKYWRYLIGNCVQTLYLDEEILTIRADYMDRHIFLAGEDGVVHVLDGATLKTVQILEPSESMFFMDGHRARVFALAPHPTRESELLSAGWDNTVQFWDIRQKHAVRHIHGPHVCGQAIEIDLYADLFITASWRRNQAIQLWQYSTGGLILDLKPDNIASMQSCAQFCGTESIVCGGGYENMIRVIEKRLRTTGFICNLPSPVGGIDTAHKPASKHTTLYACCNKELFTITTRGAKEQK